MRIRCAILSLLCAVPALAQLTGTATLKTSPAADRKALSGATQTGYPQAEGLVGGPLIGYAARTDSFAVYSLQGIPGAASPGPNSTLARAAGRPVISSYGGYALAAGQQRGELLAYRLRPKSAAGLLLPSTFHINTQPHRIVLSPLGRVALIYDRGSRQIEVLAGMPSRPNSLYTASLVGLPGVLTALAVSDDGALALAAFATADAGGTIYAFRRDTPASPAGTAGRVVHLAFVPNTGDGLAADFDRDQILVLRDGGRQGIQVLAGSSEGVRGPAAVEASTAGDIFVVNRGSGNLLMLPSAQAGVPEMIPCGCDASTLERLKSPDSFRLTTGGGVLAVLNGERGLPEVFYVPAGEETISPPSGNLPPVRIRKR